MKSGDRSFPDDFDVCAEANSLLSGLIDGELDAAGETAVRDHLEVCAKCRERAQELESLSCALRTAGRRVSAPPPWEMVERALASAVRTPLGEHVTEPMIHGGASADPTERAWPAFTVGRTALAAVAAASLVVVVGLGVTALRALRRPDAPSVSSRIAPASVPVLSLDFISKLVDPARQPDSHTFGGAPLVERAGLEDIRRQVSFEPLTPKRLPGGYLFESGWVITSDACRIVCLRYSREGRVLAILQSASDGKAICSLSNTRCCLIGGLACRRSNLDRMEVLETTRGRLALTVAAPTGETDIEAVIASLAHDRPTIPDAM